MKSRAATSPLECVDRTLGEQLWKLQAAGPGTELRDRLEAHVAVCDACREIVRLDERLRVLGREGQLGTWRPRRRERVVPIAALALAASLVGVVLLPPRPQGTAGPARGSEEPRFTRPVEGEVVAVADPLLRWTPVENAARYVIEIRDGAGRVTWTAESDAPEIRVREGGLEAGTEYRALLYVRPADLAPPAPASVVFRKGSWEDMLLHRARWAPLWVQGVAAASLLALGAALGTSRRGRER